MNIGAKIKEQREKLGLTQTQAGKRLGCSQQYWCDLEHNRTTPGINTLIPVAAALECGLSVLFVPIKRGR